GWVWGADVLAAGGAQVHLAHPLGVKAFAYRRVKNDVRDAAALADLLRMGRLPQGVDRAAPGSRVPRAGPPPRQARRDPLGLQVPGARGGGRLRDPGWDERSVRPGRQPAAGPAHPAHGVPGADQLTAPAPWRP